MRHLRQTGWITLILLAAAAMRLFALSAIPPGMTHDEADHGLTAWEIVNGARALYFTVGYGREPLYDYATALVMAGTGPTIFAARLTSVYFSLLVIAATYAWARQAFGRPVALLTAAGLAAGFWPVMAGRQALRSIALPAVFTLAVLLFWQGLWAGAKRRKGAALRLFPAAGLLLGLAFYTYIPARVMWLAFPALAVYLVVARRRSGVQIRPNKWPEARRVGIGLGLTLGVAAVVAAPLFFYLANNPGLEARIDELSAPLRAAAAGDLGPLWANARGALRLFTIEGDQTWRYNLPGRPFLGPVMGVLFYIGLAIAGLLILRGNRISPQGPGFTDLAAPGAFLALVWLALGFSPVLVTGPGLSMTQAIGALPVLYLFPALALVAGYSVWRRRLSASQITNDEVRLTSSNVAARYLPLAALVLFTALAILTARDYFDRWANAPEVRVQYETTMVAALRYLDQHGTGAASVSTITPHHYHTPAVALLTLHNPAIRPRWFDGRQSLILPGQEGGLLLVPGFTPIPAELQPYLAGATLVDELPMRPDDLDRPVRVYQLDGPALAAQSHATRFGQHAELLGYELSASAARPGDTLTLVTAWRLLAPLPEASLFAHLAGAGEPLAVADGLGAPGEAWLSGDTLLQLHRLAIHAGTPPGDYPLVVGLYTRDDGRRLMTGEGQDSVTLTSVTVADE